MTNLTYVELKKRSNNSSPLALAETLSFDEALRLACDMLKNEEWDESLQEYATSLLEELRKNNQEKWNSSWKYDALLGYAYHIILKYDERYVAYKRAFDNVAKPPP